MTTEVKTSMSKVNYHFDVIFEGISGTLDVANSPQLSFADCNWLVRYFHYNCRVELIKIAGSDIRVGFSAEFKNRNGQTEVSVQASADVTNRSCEYGSAFRAHIATDI